MACSLTRRPRPSAASAFVLALGLAALGGCSRDEAAPAQAAQPASIPAGAAPAPAANRVPSATRALRITTETTLAAADVGAAVAALRAAVVEAGGYVSELRTSSASSESASADLEARCPVQQLAAFRSGLGRAGDIVSDSEKAEDVTDQRADLKARLHSARTQEKRLLEMLSDRTGNIADVIAAEKALAEVRNQVERLEAETEALEGQIAYATVKVHIVRKRDVAAISTTGRLGAAASKGIGLVGEVALGMLVLAMTVGPTLLMLAAIGAVTYALARYISKRIARRRASSVRSDHVPITDL
jgi:hypothetical protein